MIPRRWRRWITRRQGFGIATLPDGAPLPTTLTADTSPDRALIASYRAGAINKIAQNGNAQVGVLEHGTHGDRLQVEAFAPLTLHILTASFPGWTARFNETPLTLTPDAHGLIDVTLPNAGRGELAITLGTTTPRTLGWILSWLALFALGAITLLRSRSSGDYHELLDLLPQAETRLLGAVLVGFAVVLALFAVPFAPLRLPSQTNEALASSSTIDNQSDAGLEVLAYHADAADYRPGDSIPLTLYWHTLRFLTDRYRVSVSLLDLTTGDYRLPTPLRDPGGYPTTRWLPRLYVTDPYTLTLPPDFPAGTYSPALEVCASDTGDSCPTEDSRLTFFDRSGSTYGSVLVLPIILTVE